MKNVVAFSNQAKRPYQEDSYTYGPNIFLVADGVGGNAKGDVASSIVADLWKEELTKHTITGSNVSEVVNDLVAITISKFKETTKIHPETFGMASTVAAVLQVDTAYYAVHIGDSRIYHFSSSGNIKWRSKDHSFVQELLDANVINEDEAQTHPRKNVVTRVLQAKEDTKVKASICELEHVESGDFIMVCTDGVLEAWSDMDLENLFGSKKDLEKIAATLEDRCTNISHDNFTAVIMEISTNNIKTKTMGKQGNNFFSLKSIFFTSLLLCGIGAYVIFVPNKFNRTQILTQDTKIQYILQTEIDKQIKKSNAESGIGLIMEVSTGELKAWYHSDGKSQLPDKQLQLIANTLHEPGSLFLTSSVLANIENGIDVNNDFVSINNGTYTIDDTTIHDFEKHGKDNLNVAEAFIIGSNAGISKVTNEQFNRDDESRMKLLKYFFQFGLSDSLNIIGGGKKTTYGFEEKKVSLKSQIPFLGIGYGINLSPLHILQFYNAIANEGNLMHPKFYTKINNFTKQEIITKQQTSSIASTASIKKIQSLLELNVEKGTGRLAKPNNVTVAGKTGTTRINYEYKQESAKYEASFCGYFPVKEPKYTIYIHIRDPKDLYYGSAVAAPVFKSIVDKIYNLK